MVPEIRNELLGILAYLQKKQSIVASQEDLLQVIRVVQYLLSEEAIAMAVHDNVPFQRGMETGTIYARAFQMSEDEDAHTMLGKLLARQAGYNDMDNGWEFIVGFKQGVKDASPKLIGDGKG